MVVVSKEEELKERYEELKERSKWLNEQLEHLLIEYRKLIKELISGGLSKELDGKVKDFEKFYLGNLEYLPPHIGNIIELYLRELSDESRTGPMIRLDDKL